MKKMLLLLALFLWTGLQVTFAQSRTVKGKVIDEKGEAVIGATVIVKGTTTGTVTDADGNYEINLTGDQKTLEIKYTGLATQNVSVGEGDAVGTTTMSADNTDLGEVSIYSKKLDRKSFTGSISTVTSKDIARRPITDITKALEGAAPGVAVTSGGGQPGASPDIQIRGQNTLSASGAPLIVLDGAPYSGSLVSINPNDVESMTILKDASATAIYGSRGANGVILVVTKRGIATGKPRIAIDASVGMLNRFMPLYETVNAKEYIETAFQAWNNAFGGTSGNKSQDFWNYVGNYNPYNVPNDKVLNISEMGNGYADATVNPDATQLYDDSWFDEVNRTGVRHNYNLAVSNGDKVNDYYFSVGYVNEQGIVKNSSYDRFSARLNVNSKVASWLKAGMSLAGTYEDQRFFLTEEQQAYTNIFMTAQVMAPIYPVYRYDRQGNRMTDANGEVLYDFGVNDANNPSGLPQNRKFAANQNPIASLYQDDRSTKLLNTFGNAYLEATLLKDITLRSNFSLNYIQSRTNAFQNMIYGDAVNIGGRMDRTLTNRLNYTFNQLATWKPTFSGLNNPEGTGHNADLVVGHETFFINSEASQIERTGFVAPQFQEGAAGAIGTGSTSAINQLAMESYFSILSYNYASRYYLSGSLRRDGSSRFSPKSRWGTFWSIGAGWMLNEEAFLKDVTWLNMLKLRGSYGVTGNEALNVAGYYAWMPRYNFLPNNNNPGLLFSTWGNEELKWEGSYKFNVGFDFGLFKNRIFGNIDYFRSGASNLLYVQPFAPSVGTGGIYSNVGDMANTGVELQVSADIVREKAFTWNARVNLTHLRNKITSVQGRDSLISTGTILTKGYAVGSFFLPHYAGVNDAGEATYRLRDGSTTNDYRDLTPEDYDILGSSFRDLEGSVTNTFSYKNFDLSFLVSFGIGGKFYDNTYAGLMRSNPGQTYHKDILNAWRQKGDEANTDVPKVQYDLTNDNPLSDRFLVSNSFLNIKNVNLGYTIPASTLKRLKLSALRVYVAADNLFYLSARKGLDVQQQFFGASSFTYFPYRTIVFGLNLGL